MKKYEKASKQAFHSWKYTPTISLSCFKKPDAYILQSPVELLQETKPAGSAKLLPASYISCRNSSARFNSLSKIYSQFNHDYVNEWILDP